MAEAGGSEDKAVYEQIPPQLRKSKSLILSPPGLIDNWWDEFHTWLPMEPDKDLLCDRFIGKIFCVTSQQAMPERLEKLKEWDADGGVLVMGYSMFRKLAGQQGKRPLLAADDQLAVKKILLEGLGSRRSPETIEH